MCAIPDYKGPPEFDTTRCDDSLLEYIVEEFKAVILHHTPGRTNDAYYPTFSNPVRVPPRNIPVYYQIEVMQESEPMVLLHAVKAFGWPLQTLCLKSCVS